jgi:hypothetical protein
MNIRKNASLKSVAIAAREEADSAFANWQRCVAGHEGTPFGSPDKMWRGFQATEAWKAYRTLNELAKHIERLAAK